MYELHENEQYFFDKPTVTHLADFVQGYDNPCCLCAPLLGQELVRRGVRVRILDIDERFAHLDGFRRYDIYRPEWLGEEFGLIVCDPPFYNVSLSQLFAAIRMLSRNLYTQPLLVSYLARRSASVLGTFARFALEPTGYRPGYQTVQKAARNEIEFFGNLGEAEHSRLADTT
jgi:putative N6-adenine methyltransferase